MNHADKIEIWINFLTGVLHYTFFTFIAQICTFDTLILTRAVLVFATKRKNNVDPRPRAQKKVNYVQLFFAK